MKKILTLIAAVMATMTMSAQTTGIKSFKLEGALSKQNIEIANPVKKAPVRKALPENQLWMGNFTSDTYDSYGSGFGLTSYAGETTIATEVSATTIAGFDGGSMIGMRIGLAESTPVSEMFIYGVSDSAMDLLATGTPESTNVGWNQVTFDTPATLDLSKYSELLIGYVYTQTDSNYPFTLVAEGDEYVETLVYGDYGSGEGWYYIGTSSYGNLAVQVLVEKDFEKYSVNGVSCKDTYAMVGNEGTLNYQFKNLGTASIENVSYTVECDGQTSEEKTYTLPTAVTFGQTFTLPVDVNAEAEPCTKVYTATVTKINGEANTSESNSVVGNFVAVKKLFSHQVAVEEYTGTGCGWCPRGWVGMNKLRETFGDKFIGIALHQYSGRTTDAMNISSTDYASLSFSGAPSCMIERGEEIDPYYGSDADVCVDFQDALGEVTPVGVEVSGQFDADYSTVAATATVESFMDKEFDIEYVLIADGLTGTTGFKQSNYYASYYSSSQLPEDLAPFGSGGTYGKSTVSGLTFNDVAIASSYKSSKNQATLGALTAYTPVENTFTLTMPTYSKLVTAIKNANYDVWVAALIIDPTTGKIVNANKSKVAVDPTGIKNVNNDNANSDVMYNIAGQRVNANAKGIVIVNGKKIIK